jgi:hypothetical protein
LKLKIKYGMKTIIIIVFTIFIAEFTYAQPAEGAYFSNTELQLHPRKVMASNGQIAYMWSDCYEQLNFMQRADLKLYYDSVLKSVNQKIEETQKNNLPQPNKINDLGYWEAEKSFYIRKLKFIRDYDDWEAK